MTSINDDLIRAYKNATKLILENPNNKNNIINEYIDLVYKISGNDNANTNLNGNLNANGNGNGNDNANLNGNLNANGNDNSELSKMLKNPLEISIYNNFQRYNDGTTDNIINPILKNMNNNKLKREDYLKQLANEKNKYHYNRSPGSNGSDIN